MKPARSNIITGVFPKMANVDYLRDANSSKYILCEKIMDYYKRRGQHKNIELRVERQGNVVVVRSNIKFNCNTLMTKAN